MSAELRRCGVLMNFFRPVGRTISFLIAISFLLGDPSSRLATAGKARGADPSKNTLATPSRFEKLLSRRGQNAKLASALALALGRLRAKWDAIPDAEKTKDNNASLIEMAKHFNKEFEKLNKQVGGIPNHLCLFSQVQPLYYKGKVTWYFPMSYGVRGENPVERILMLLPPEAFKNDQAEYDEYLQWVGIRNAEDREALDVVKVWLASEANLPNVMEDMFEIPGGPKVSMAQFTEFGKKVQDVVAHDSPKMRVDGNDLVLEYVKEGGAKTEERMANSPIAEIYRKAGLTETPLVGNATPGRNPIDQHLQWVADAARLAQIDVFHGPLLAPVAQKFDGLLESRKGARKEEVNVKAVTIAQIERDFADPKTAALIKKELDSGIRYMVLMPLGEGAADAKLRLAHGNVGMDRVYDPARDKNKPGQGFMHLVSAIEPDNSVNVDELVARFKQELAYALGEKTISEDTWMALMSDPEDPKGVTNFVAAFDRGMKLKGDAAKEIRYCMVDDGVRLSQVLTTLQGLFTSPLRALVREHHKELSVAGFSNSDLATMENARENLILPPSGFASGTTMRHMNNLKSSDTVLDWA